MKKTKLSQRSKRRKSHTPNIWLGLSALTLAILLNQLYLRYRVISIVPREPQLELLSSGLMAPTHAVESTYPQMVIADLDLTLPIYPAHIVGGKWETTSRGLSYASSTAPLGGSGNSVIYGHNWPNMLKNLPKLAPGDQLLINLSDDKKISYTVTYTAIVSPSDASLTRPTTDNRLTLYTCTGLFDQDRYVVVAHLN